MTHIDRPAKFLKQASEPGGTPRLAGREGLLLRYVVRNAKMNQKRGIEAHFDEIYYSKSRKKAQVIAAFIGQMGE
jgi:hypothetical protein